MEFFSAIPYVDDKISLVKQVEVFTGTLTGHGQVAAKLAEGLTVGGKKVVKQSSPGRIG